MFKDWETQVNLTENKTSFSAAESEVSGGLGSLHNTPDWNKKYTKFK